MTISEAIPKTISNSSTMYNSEAISEAIPKSVSNHSNCDTLHQEGGLLRGYCEAVGRHLCSRYVAEVNLPISSHMCT